LYSCSARLQGDVLLEQGVRREQSGGREIDGREARLTPFSQPGVVEQVHLISQMTFHHHDPYTKKIASQTKHLSTVNAFGEWCGERAKGMN